MKQIKRDAVRDFALMASSGTGEGIMRATTALLTEMGYEVASDPPTFKVGDRVERVKGNDHVSLWNRRAPDAEALAAAKREAYEEAAKVAEKLMQCDEEHLYQEAPVVQIAQEIRDAIRSLTKKDGTV